MALAVGLDGRVGGVVRAVVLALPALLTFPSVPDRYHLRHNGRLCSGRALRRTWPDGVAVSEVRGERMLGDRDGHERVRLRVGVVTDRHLGRRVLSSCRRGMHQGHEPRRIADPGQRREHTDRKRKGGQACVS